MAMKALRVTAALLAMFFLVSCQVLEFIFGSIFPSTVTLIKAQVDLSGRIPDSSNGSSSGGKVNVKVVESGGYGYVVVTATLASTGITAFFYDFDLNLKATFTGLAASGVMADAGGLIVVGSLHRNPDLSPAGTGTISPVSLSPFGGSGVDGFVSSGSNMEGLGMSGATLNITSYNAAWTTPSPSSYVISTTQSSLEIEAVFDDGGLNVILVLCPPGGNNGNVTGYFLTVAKNNFTVAGLTNLLDISPHRDSLDGGSFGFSQGSIFAYDTGSSSFVRIDPATTSTQGSFSGSDPSSTRFAYRVSGGSFYGFDTKTRLLTKYAAWW